MPAWQNATRMLYQRRALSIAAGLLLTLLGLLSGCTRTPPPSPTAPIAPIVILISFDGWRWDYLDRVPAPRLSELASRGVRAQALIPAFPTQTFPNHYTLVTGLTPAHHGIVGNAIVDPAYPERFTMAAATAKESRWWGGEPLGVTAEAQGVRSAAMFWPGSEAEIKGQRPTFWKPYDEGMPDTARVDQVLQWLALPDDQRPRFFTLYFEGVDSAGHDHGPESVEVDRAAARLDLALGRLVDGVRQLGLDDRTHFVVTSDHGMAEVAFERSVYLDDYIDLSTIDIVNSGAFLAIVPRRGTAEDVVRALKGRHPALDVYLRMDTPAHLQYRDNERIAPVIGLVREGWLVVRRGAADRGPADARQGSAGGAHGYDTTAPSMGGLFVAAGPNVREGVVVEPFANVHVYNFLCALLGITPATNDGDERVASIVIKN